MPTESDLTDLEDLRRERDELRAKLARARELLIALKVIAQPFVGDEKAGALAREVVKVEVP